MTEMVNGRCIDYPCCGHTDGLPCDWTPPPPGRYIPGWDDDDDEDCAELGHSLDEEGLCIDCGESEAAGGFFPPDTPLALDP